MALFFYEKRYLNKIKAFHSLNKNEKEQIQNFFPNKNIIKISAAGIDKSSKKQSEFKLNWLSKINKKDKILLFLGRLEPEKGIRELIEARGQLVKESEKEWLVVIGCWIWNNGKLCEK